MAVRLAMLMLSAGVPMITGGDEMSRSATRTHYGYKYDYKARAIDRAMYVGPLPAFAVELAQLLIKRELLEELPTQCRSRGSTSKAMVTARCGL